MTKRMQNDNVVDKYPTGIAGLDAITQGGIPVGRTTLITGRSGAGKSILSLQVAAHLASLGMRTVYFAAEERPDDLRETGDGLGFRVGELEKQGQLTFVDLRRPVDGPILITGDYDASGLVARIASAARAAQANTIVIDSVNAVFHPRPPQEQLRAHFFYLVQALEHMDFTVLMTTEASADYARPTMLGVEDYVCDLVLVLRNVVDGKRRRRTIEVHKFRRSAHKKGEYPCTIANRGMTIFPLDAASLEETRSHGNERVSSGVAGLDEMCNGGWLRNSLVLVRGPSGSGKTTLSGMYARAGAMRGERVLYYKFEEAKPVLFRNFASLGLPMTDLEESGTLRFVCLYPEATSPEDLLIELRKDLEEYRPSLVVIDSITSIEHSTSPEGLRIFLSGLASLLREKARSGLLTQTIGAQGERHQDVPYLAAIVDAILVLDYSMDEPELRRTMRVLKMRGSAHDTRQVTIAIGPGGIRPIPRDGAP